MDKMKIGFIGFGEVNTPIELLISNVNDAKERLAHNGIEVTYGELVTDDIDRHGSDEAIERLSCSSLDVLILCVAVWIPIYALIPTEDAFKNVPMILWGAVRRKRSGCSCGHDRRVGDIKLCDVRCAF